MSLGWTLIFFSFAAPASAGGGFLEQKEAVEKENLMKTKDQQMVEEHSEMEKTSAEASAMKNAMMASLAHWQTEEGKKEHEKVFKEKAVASLTDAVEEMEWYSDVAKDGIMKFGNGQTFHALDMPGGMGKLPKGMPDFPKDPKEYDEFLKTLPVDAGTYGTMLSVKKDPSKYVAVAQGKFKGALTSLVEDNAHSKDLQFFDVAAKSAVEHQASVEEKKQSTVEILKASPKAFKKALRSWEKIVPEAATLLLQTSSADSEQQATDLASRGRNLHTQLYSAVETASNKAALMSVAQNRITSLLMRQAEETLKDFDALDGCTEAAKDFSGAESRCLCVADNICHKMEHSKSGNLCSVVSSSTCMVPTTQEEAKEMSTV